MKDYLLDTNIISHFAKIKMDIITAETLKIKNYLDRISDDAKIFFSAISIGEIEYGYMVAKQNIKEDIKIICDYIKNYEILEITEDIARNCYADLRSRLFEKYAPKNEKKKRRPAEWKDPITDKNIQVQENDIWICAVAKYYNLILVTNDKMEAIKSISDIEIQNWS